MGKKFLDEEFNESPLKKPADSSSNALSVLTGMTEKRALAVKQIEKTFSACKRFKVGD